MAITAVTGPVFAAQPGTRAPQAAAVVVWEDDAFDGLALGDLDGQNGWLLASPQRASAEVVSDPTGGQLLFIDAAPGATIVMGKDVPDQTSGRHLFSFRVRVIDATLPSLAKIEVRTNPTPDWDKKFQLYFGSSMRLNYGPQGQARFFVTEGAMELGRWYEIEAEINLAREHVDISVDGALVLNDVPIFPGPITDLGISGWERPGAVELDDLLGQSRDDPGGGGCDGERPPTERISVANDGEEGNGTSRYPSISGDGRWVAFSSTSTNLDPDDDYTAADIYVYDRDTCTVRVVSLGDEGPGNSGSLYPSISDDGLVVAFQSSATNFLVEDDQRVDTNGYGDVYVAVDGQVEGVTVRRDGFVSNRGAVSPALSGDGAWIAFESTSDNLVTPDGAATRDIFVTAVGSALYRRISQGAAGEQGDGGSFAPAISGSGRFIAFDSLAENLVGDDDNEDKDIFVYDQNAEAMERVSLDSDGFQASGDSGIAAISSGGQFVTYSSTAHLTPDDLNGYWDRYMRDRDAGATVRTSDGGVVGWPADVSTDGRFVLNGEGGIQVLDRLLDTLTRADLKPDGSEPMYAGTNPSMSDDGRYVAFDYLYGDLVPDDTNGVADVFVRDMGLPASAVNSDPLADAGPDLEATAIGFTATVQLDGRLSFDPDGDPLIYSWSGPFGTAGGAEPEVTLGIGSHTVELEVSDDSAATDTDELTVTVVPEIGWIFGDDFESGGTASWSIAVL